MNRLNKINCNILSGWPAFHQSTVHASPLLYDIDKDGVREIALATYNGEVLFFRYFFSVVVM